MEPNQNANPQNEAYDELFPAVAEAYEHLSDPMKRASYDLERGNGGNIEQLLELQRKDAERASMLMAVSFDQRRKSELSCDGLIVDDAWYGASEAVIEPEKHASQVINVTRQLQCLVDGSKLVIAKGDAKSHLTGVYDPCPGNAEKALRVDYFFKGKLHQALVRDDEMLLAPIIAHRVDKAKKAGAKKKRDDRLPPQQQPRAAQRAGRPSLSVAVAFAGLMAVVLARGLMVQ